MIPKLSKSCGRDRVWFPIVLSCSVLSAVSLDGKSHCFPRTRVQDISLFEPIQGNHSVVFLVGELMRVFFSRSAGLFSFLEQMKISEAAMCLLHWTGRPAGLKVAGRRLSHVMHTHKHTQCTITVTSLP